MTEEELKTAVRKHFDGYTLGDMDVNLYGFIHSADGSTVMLVMDVETPKQRAQVIREYLAKAHGIAFVFLSEGWVKTITVEHYERICASTAEEEWPVVEKLEEEGVKTMYHLTELLTMENGTKWNIPSSIMAGGSTKDHKYAIMRPYDTATGEPLEEEHELSDEVSGGMFPEFPTQEIIDNDILSYGYVQGFISIETVKKLKEGGILEEFLQKMETSVKAIEGQLEAKDEHP